MSFDEFWRQYPRKVAKGRARRAWAKHKPDEGQEAKILEALKAQCFLWRKEGTAKEFIPYPATWLNDERWEDDELREAWREMKRLGRYRTGYSTDPVSVADLVRGTEGE